MRTMTVAARSRRDRGLKADRIPTGIAISIQMIAPPKTREAVTGTASTTISLTSRLRVHDSPNEPWRTLQTNVPYSS